MARDIDGHSLLELVERVRNGTFLAIDCNGAVLIVEILEGENRVLNVVAIGGRLMVSWLDQVMDCLKRLARDQQCSKIRVQGRKGWEKVLAGYGYTPRAVILECDA